MAQPFISVVIPTYNRAAFIREAVDSVLGQTFQDFELIVVDDGSTDDTAAVLKPYGDRLRYVYQANAGCSAARNRGAREARGEWIAFLDSDDVWRPEKLATQVNDLRQFPQANAHACNATIYRDHIGKEVDIFSYSGYSRDYPESVTFFERPLVAQIRHGFAWPQCVLMRRSVLLDAGLLDTTVKLWQDVDLFCRVAAQGRWLANSTVLVGILRRQEAAIDLSRQSVERPVWAFTELGRVFDKLRDCPDLTEAERRFVIRRLSNAYSTLGLLQLKQGDRAAARQMLLRGFQTHRSVKSAAKCAALLLPNSLSTACVAKWRSLKVRLLRRREQGGVHQSRSRS